MGRARGPTADICREFRYLLVIHAYAMQNEVVIRQLGRECLEAEWESSSRFLAYSDPDPIYATIWGWELLESNQELITTFVPKRKVVQF